jgi:hypothetical protein
MPLGGTEAGLAAFTEVLGQGVKVAAIRLIPINLRVNGRDRIEPR